MQFLYENVTATSFKVKLTNNTTVVIRGHERYEGQHGFHSDEMVRLVDAKLIKQVRPKRTPITKQAEPWIQPEPQVHVLPVEEKQETETLEAQASDEESAEEVRRVRNRR